MPFLLTTLSAGHNFNIPLLSISVSSSSPGKEQQEGGQATGACHCDTRNLVKEISIINFY